MPSSAVQPMTCPYALWGRSSNWFLVWAAVLVEQFVVEIPVLGALVSERAVERVVEHRSESASALSEFSGSRVVFTRYGCRAPLERKAEARPWRGSVVAEVIVRAGSLRLRPRR